MGDLEAQRLLSCVSVSVIFRADNAVDIISELYNQADNAHIFKRKGGVWNEKKRREELEEADHNIT